MNRARLSLCPARPAAVMVLALCAVRPVIAQAPPPAPQPIAPPPVTLKPIAPPTPHPTTTVIAPAPTTTAPHPATPTTAKATKPAPPPTQAHARSATVRRTPAPAPTPKPDYLIVTRKSYHPAFKPEYLAPKSQLTPHQAMLLDLRALSGLKGRDLERTYLEMMMDHQRSGINLARLATQQSTNPQVRQQAWRIMAENQDQINQMRYCLRRWYGYNRTAKPEPRMAEVMNELTGHSGAAFDRAFAQVMADHQQGAILASLSVSQRAPHRLTRRVANQVAQGTRRNQRALLGVAA